MSSTGIFITVEGVEGVGKSTNIETLTTWLDGKGVKYLVTREPGGTVIAEKIRQLLLQTSEEALDPGSELLLVFAARAQHLEQKIKPALKRGEWVVCDRFTDATYAYQGGGRQLPRQAIATLEELVQKGLRPDLTLILDLDPKTGLARAQARGALDRFEQEHIEFFNRVRQCYLDIAQQQPQRCAVIDASQPLERVAASLTQILEDRLGTHLL